MTNDVKMLILCLSYFITTINLVCFVHNFGSNTIFENRKDPIFGVIFKIDSSINFSALGLEIKTAQYICVLNTKNTFY